MMGVGNIYCGGDKEVLRIMRSKGWVEEKCMVENNKWSRQREV